MADSISFAQQVLIVVVIYKTDLKHVLANLAPILSYNPVVYLYDNSPQPQDARSLGVIYHHDPLNSGVSKAYNKASAHASRLEKKWMLLLDQDTQIPSTLFNSFAEAIALYTDVPIFCPVMTDTHGIVSPYKLIWGKSFRQKNIPAGIHDLNKWVMINSGTLIQTECFKKSGGFDERFPLDFSDVVFFNRLRSSCSQFVVVRESCRHSLSSSDRTADIHQIFERVKNYSKAARLYQKVCNNFVWMSLPIFTLCIKLSIRYRSLKFLKIAAGSA
jgi:rhamnosyltransferase